MYKNALILSIFFLTSCGNDVVNQDESIESDNSVDWSDTNSCKSTVDPDFINTLIKNMTLEQKVGQIIMPDIDEVTPMQAKEYFLGSFLNGGGKFPNKNKNSSIDDWKELSKAYYLSLIHI